MQRRLSIINDIVSTMNTRNKYSGKLFVATNCTHIHLERGEVTYDHFFNGAESTNFWNAVKFVIEENYDI